MAFKVRAFHHNGALQWEEREESEATARELALNTSAVKGQKGWSVYVLKDRQRVAAYRNGKEFTPRERSRG